MSTSGTQPQESTVDRLRQEFERLIDNVWTQGEKAADAMGLKSRWTPPLDIYETPESVQVVMDLPGIDPAAVQILLTGNMLTIKGERQPTVAANLDVTHRRERVSGAFQRAIPLPVTVDANHVSATSKNGVLTVTLGRVPPAQAREIRVETPAAPVDVTPQM